MSPSIQRLELVESAAAGNRFLVADAFAGCEPPNPAGLARTLGDVDGLLLLQRPTARGDCRMVLYNKDGSRPEACGNGLRCVARFCVERGYVPTDELVVETDAGPRRVRVLREGGEIVAARSELGVPEIESPRTRIELSTGELEVGLVSLGNPHCVVFVDDVGAFPVERIGAEIECHERFPRRTNVEFVQLGGAGLRVRIYERGVGETASCGTGASAAAVIALRRGFLSSPVEIETPGGNLTVDWSGAGPLWLTGPVDPTG